MGKKRHHTREHQQVCNIISNWPHPTHILSVQWTSYFMSWRHPLYRWNTCRKSFIMSYNDVWFTTKLLIVFLHFLSSYSNRVFWCPEYISAASPFCTKRTFFGGLVSTIYGSRKKVCFEKKVWYHWYFEMMNGQFNILLNYSHSII